MKREQQDRYRAYRRSALLAKYRSATRRKKNFKLAFFDIDSTIADSHPRISNKIRRFLERNGFGIVFVTSRTEEMLITQTARKKSPHFIRPLPHLGIKTDEKNRQFRYYVDPKNVIPRGLLDPDIVVGSTGTAIWVRQTDGSYVPDVGYTWQFGIEPEAWRASALRFIKRLGGSRLCRISDIDNKINYEENKTDVYPPDYRIELIFRNSSSLKIFRSHFIQRDFGYVFENFHFINDSKPEKNRYSAYLTPRSGTKLQAKLHIVRSLLTLLTVAEYDKLQIVTAGDSWPDLLLAAETVTSRETFILAASSRLTRPLLQSLSSKRKAFFAEEDLTPFTQKLEATGKKGIYRLRTDDGFFVKFVIADLLDGPQRPAESVYAFLKHHNKHD